MALREASLNDAQQELNRRLHSVRASVKTKMDNVERYLIDDIEAANVAVAPSVAAYPAASTPPSPRRVARTVPPHETNECQLCGLDRDIHAFCALTGKLHTAPATQFEAVRNALLLQQDPSHREIPTQTFSQPPDLNTVDVVSGGFKGKLQLGGYCLVKGEGEVRRACQGGSVAWQEGMRRYCGGKRLGRVTFAKKHCPAADVTFPGGESWLFPSAALIPYEVAENLDMLDRYPMDENDDWRDGPNVTHRDDTKDDHFLNGLEQRIYEKNLENKASELQMRYIEMYVQIYKEERRSRKRLKNYFRDLKEMHNLDSGPPRGGYPSRRRVRGISPQGPIPVSEPPIMGTTLPVAFDRHTPHDDWQVVGMSNGGYYIFDDAEFLNATTEIDESGGGRQVPHLHSPQRRRGSPMHSVRPSYGFAHKESLL